VPVPAILSLVSVRTTLVVLCALAFTIAVTQLTYEPAAPIAATSVRGWPNLRLARLGVGTVACLVLAGVTAPSQARLVAINALLVLLAEGLLAARMLGTTLAWTLPTAHLTAALVFGYDAMGNTHQWAWFIDSRCTAGELLLAAAAACATTVWWAQQSVDDAIEVH
jgi:hypothetical protein